MQAENCQKVFRTEIWVMALEAADASLVADRWLLVVLPDQVLRFDLKLIDLHFRKEIRNDESGNATGETVEDAAGTVEQPWKLEEIRTGLRELAAPLKG